MWPRVVEIMLACWLAISPFIFRYSGEMRFYWANDLVCATLIACFALLSLSRRFDKLHLATLIVCAWLYGVAWFAEPSPPSPHLQNYAVLALLLLIFAIIPSRAGMPPKGWLDYYAEKARREQ